MRWSTTDPVTEDSKVCVVWVHADKWLACKFVQLCVCVYVYRIVFFVIFGTELKYWF